MTFSYLRDRTRLAILCNVGDYVLCYTSSQPYRNCVSYLLRDLNLTSAPFERIREVLNSCSLIMSDRAINLHSRISRDPLWMQIAPLLRLEEFSPYCHRGLIPFKPTHNISCTGRFLRPTSGKKFGRLSCYIESPAARGNYSITPQGFFGGVAPDMNLSRSKRAGNNSPKQKRLLGWQSSAPGMQIHV